MKLLYSIAMIVVGFVLLVKGADMFVDNASGIAKKLKVSPVVVGLTIVAFGTSLPELAVSATAALQGSNAIAVGNVIGSNMFNLLVVGGFSACFVPLVCDEVLLKRDWPLSTFAAVLLAFFLFGGQTVSRFEAVILLVLFVLVLGTQLKHAKKQEETALEPRTMGKLILFLVIGVAAIIIGGQVTVEGATSLARLLGLSETLIGLTVVAVGTSLPELVTSVVATRKNENDIAIGNIIGSNLFNILCILGVSAFLHPIQVEWASFFDALILCGVSMIFWLASRRRPLYRKTGILMILTYVAYMIYIIVR